MRRRPVEHKRKVKTRFGRLIKVINKGVRYRRSYGDDIADVLQQQKRFISGLPQSRQNELDHLARQYRALGDYVEGQTPDERLRLMNVNPHKLYKFEREYIVNRYEPMKKYGNYPMRISRLSREGERHSVVPGQARTGQTSIIPFAKAEEIKSLKKEWREKVKRG